MPEPDRDGDASGPGALQDGEPHGVGGPSRLMLPPVRTAHLLPLVDAKLIDLLRALDAREWNPPTVAPAWTVKDVAAHLLDTQQRLVSRLRGEPPPPSPAIRSDADLVAFINRLNAEGVRRYRRLDPAALIARLEDGRRLRAHHQSLDPFAAAMFAVSWAGETRRRTGFTPRASSPNAGTISSRSASPSGTRHYDARVSITRSSTASCARCRSPIATSTREPGTVARFTVAGDCGGGWHLSRDAAGWHLVDAPAGARRRRRPSRRRSPGGSSRKA